MIRYIPFLKAKQNEVKSMSELAPNVKVAICPFFDFPRKKQYTIADYTNTAKRIADSLGNNWGSKAEFYFDDLDIAQKIILGGVQQYGFLLSALSKLQVIPVVGLGRGDHNDAVASLKRKGAIVSNTVAFRVSPDDFEDFSLSKEEIQSDLSSIFNQFAQIDLILDCRVCTGLDPATTAKQIAAFSREFCGIYPVRRVIVTGSSIPASSSEVLGVNTTCTVARRELDIIAKVGVLHKHAPVIAGDYAIVSPFYSDAELAPEIMQNIMTARFTYTFKGSHYFIRGSSMKSAGYEQYFGLARTLCGNSFFRGPTYSSGDAYLHEKSRRIGKNCTPSSVIKPSIVAHITYMVLGAKP